MDERSELSDEFILLEWNEFIVSEIEYYLTKQEWLKFDLCEHVWVGASDPNYYGIMLTFHNDIKTIDYIYIYGKLEDCENSGNSWSNIIYLPDDNTYKKDKMPNDIATVIYHFYNAFHDQLEDNICYEPGIINQALQSIQQKKRLENAS